jgi:hypothetical protein
LPSDAGGLILKEGEEGYDAEFASPTCFAANLP